MSGGKEGRHRAVAAVVDLVLPQRCAACGALGEACCRACGSVFDAPRRVYKRGAGSTTPVYALAGYTDPARALVLSYKERGRRELVKPLGRALASGVVALHGDREIWLVPVPSRRAAAMSRGGSHMLRLAGSAAASLAASGTAAGVAPALRMAAGTRDSVGLSASARVANLAGRIRPDPAGFPPPGAALVLVDDVVSTGATVAACTRILRRAGFSVDAVLALTATNGH